MRGSKLVSPLVLVAIFLGVATARADRVDDELLERIPQVIAQLKDKGYKNIGVLNFQYQHGRGPARFSGVPICNNLPRRIENALALKLTAKDPELLLLSNAGNVAVKTLAGASYRTPADRQKLLDLQLTPAWGPGTAKADAFIIGKVSSSPDLRKVSVSVGAFDRDATFDLCEFEVKTDRALVAEVGQGFSLTKNRTRGLSDKAFFAGLQSDIEWTQRAIDEAEASKEFPVELTVYYDDTLQPLEIDRSAEGSNNQALPEPKQGQNLTFGLKNRTNRPLGVVLLVNGVSTLYEQEGPPEDLNKWVLEPGQEYRVKGYHQEGNEKYFAITMLSHEESKKRFDDLGGPEFAGLIHLYVFQTTEPELAEVPKFTRSIGRLSRAEREVTRYESLRDLQQAIARKSDLFPPGTRPLAAWGKERKESLQEKKLGATTLTDALVVRYAKSSP